MKTEAPSDPSLILHPIRVRIVYAVEGRSMTPGQIALEMPDVPQASLYRHIKKLLTAGVLVIAEERQVHGTVERVYEVDPSAVMVDPRKLVSNRDHAVRYFEVYLSCLRHAFARYMGQPAFDFKQDGVTFFTEFAYLSDQEQIAFNKGIRQLLNTVTRNPEAKNRRRRNLSFLALPEPAPLQATTAQPPMPTQT